MDSELVIGNKRFPLDKHGYLAEPDLWSPGFAECLAGQDQLQLSAAHWEVIQFVRDYYAEFDLSPPMRVLVKALRRRLGEDKGNSRYLYRLFPQGPAKQVTRYAGLPKPVSCI